MSQYRDVANEIISKSINSVTYIDDELLEPFSDETDGSIDLSKKVYESFRNENCCIDFYKFRDTDEWQSKSTSFAGKDLLILDWQLAKTSPEFKPTLKILADAVKKPNLHFVCIYTATTSQDFDDIFFYINAYFAPFENAILLDDLQAIKDIIENNGYDFDQVFSEEIIALLKEMVIYRSNAGDTLNSIKKKISETHSSELLNEINKHFINRVKEKKYTNVLHGFCALSISILKADLSGDSIVSSADIRNYPSKNFLIVNHTIILLTNKTEVQPQSLYGRFRDALIDDSGNFLTLMGLEMRNLFKESSSFIGKDIDSINELAFFHHKERAVPTGAFYDFLRELWKSQAASFLYDKDISLRIFDALEDYKQQKSIGDKMKGFISDSKTYVQHLGKLNYYYNTLVASRPDNDMIKFGDVFNMKVDGKPTDDYLLCVTAHCDCLYAKDKINNMFYFVKGSKTNLEKALKAGDTGFDSYILKNNIIEAISWFPKPFTVYIKPTMNNINNDIDVVLGESGKTLTYFTTLKENYAQRIANGAFIYPLHVGIFFADTKE